MMTLKKKTNGKTLSINLYFCNIELTKMSKDKDIEDIEDIEPIKTILQVNRWQNGYCDLYIKLFAYSLNLNSLKLSKGKRYHKTLFKNL